MNAAILVAHVVLVTLAFGYIIFFDFVLANVARTRDIRAIRTSFPAALRTARWAGLILGLGVLFGFARAIAVHFPLLSGWLVLSYILLFVAGGLGIGGTFRRHVRVLRAALKSPDDQVSPELEAAIEADWPIGAWIMIVFMVALVYVMFTKPL
jgi:hypothetical protein